MTAQFRRLVTDSGSVIYVAESSFHTNVVTSTTRPANPSVGDEIYESDTGKTLYYQSVLTGWTPPWDTPWTNVAEAVRTSSQDVLTVIDVTGLTVTFNSPGHRLYRVSLQARGLNVNLAGTDTTEIDTGASGAGTIITGAAVTFTAASQWGNFNCFSPLQSPAAGSVSYHVRATAAATNALRTSASAANPWVLTVDDMGNNGPPL